MWSCHAMALRKKKLSARLMAISTTIPRAARCSRLDTTNHAPNSPTMATEAPTAGKIGGGREATEGRPGLAGTPRALAHALHALLADRGRAHAVRARVTPAPDAGYVRFPAGVPVTGGNLVPAGTGIAGRAHSWSDRARECWYRVLP